MQCEDMRDTVQDVCEENGSRMVTAGRSPDFRGVLCGVDEGGERSAERSTGHVLDVFFLLICAAFSAERSELTSCYCSVW